MVPPPALRQNNVGTGHSFLFYAAMRLCRKVCLPIHGLTPPTPSFFLFVTYFIILSVIMCRVRIS